MIGGVSLQTAFVSVLWARLRHVTIVRSTTNYRKAYFTLQQTTHYALHTNYTTPFPYFYKRAHFSAPATRQHILNALVRNPRDGAGGPKHRDARAEAAPEAAKAALCGHGA